MNEVTNAPVTPEGSLPPNFGAEDAGRLTVEQALVEAHHANAAGDLRAEVEEDNRGDGMGLGRWSGGAQRQAELRQLKEGHERVVAAREDAGNAATQLHTEGKPVTDQAVRERTEQIRRGRETQERNAAEDAADQPPLFH